MTDEGRLEYLEQEVGRQKRRNRWLLGAIILVAGGMSALFVFEAVAPRTRGQETKTDQEIRARRIVLEDEHGKTRAVLGVDTGGAALALYDENDKGRAVLALSKDGPALALWDENGHNRAVLVAHKSGPNLALFDETGRARFTAGKTSTVSPEGETVEYPESSLILFGSDGKIIWSAAK